MESSMKINEHVTDSDKIQKVKIVRIFHDCSMFLCSSRYRVEEDTAVKMNEGGGGITKSFKQFGSNSQQ